MRDLLTFAAMLILAVIATSTTAGVLQARAVSHIAEEGALGEQALLLAKPWSCKASTEPPCKVPSGFSY
ncbi:MAG: hypothetical protein JSR90_02400 [Proteobacteria bacterium]|nr:hypothetical protein [Pseudomonadota bacterium]